MFGSTAQKIKFSINVFFSKYDQILHFLCNIPSKHLLILKTSWRRLEDVWPGRIYWSWPGRLEDVLKTSSEEVRLRRAYSSWSRRLEDVLKTSSEDVRLRRTYSSWSRRLENVFWRRRRITSSRRLHQDECLLGRFLNTLLGSEEV